MINTSIRLNESDVMHITYILTKDPRVGGQVATSITTAYQDCANLEPDWNEVIRKSKLLFMDEEVIARIEMRTLSFSIDREVFNKVKNSINEQLGTTRPRIAFITRMAILALCVRLSERDKLVKEDVVEEKIDGVSLIRQIAELFESSTPEAKEKILKIKGILEGGKKILISEGETVKRSLDTLKMCDVSAVGVSQIRICDVSAVGMVQSGKKLGYKGDRKNRIIELIKGIKDDCDVLSVREMPHSILKEIQPYMEHEGFKTYVPKGLEEYPNRYSQQLLQILFVRNNVEFTQEFRPENFDTTFRYICGRFSFAGEKIFFKTSHVPCWNDGYTKETNIKRKICMLQDELDYQKTKSECLAISLGDFNCGAIGDFHGQKEFKELEWTDTVLVPTYDNKYLDHCFLSPELVASDKIKVTTEVIDDYYMTHSDHKIIRVTLSASA